MKQTLNSIYEIYFNNMSLVKNPLPKNPQAYNPHAGFKLTQYFATAEEKDFENIFPAMIAEEDFAGLKSLIKKMRKSVNNFNIKHKSAKSYCMSFLKFLETIIATPNKYKKIVKQMQRVYHIDGIESLIEALGGDSVLIRKAIAESYFFDPTLVSNRFNEIANDYSAQKPIPARWQSVRKSGIVSQCGYNACDIDTNGNAKVRSVITKDTGYTISAGNTIFVNYKISHIWGNAQDPRYFTNYWNLVLVPAWANDLLDKPNAEPGSITSKMLNTYMRICNVLYNMNVLAWNNINMTAPTTKTPKDVVKGDFVFNVIGASVNNKLGHIDKKRIKL